MTEHPADARPGQPKRSPASLFGGIACGIGALILTVLLAGGPRPLSIAVGVVVGSALGVWIRLADL